MSRATDPKATAVYVSVEPYDVWVGPAPEPVTGKKLSAARWGLQVEGSTAEERLLDWLEKMERDPARVKRAQLELGELRLGCSCPPPCPAQALARIADGESPAEIKAALFADGTMTDQKSLFAQEATQ